MPGRPDGPRDEYAGPESGPEPPYPIKLSGPVIRGFGRGSKELGIPTANIPPSNLDQYPDLATGIYFGYTSLLQPPSTSTPDNTSTPQANASQPASNGTHPAIQIFPSVLSIGYNPFYANKTRSIEIHVLHDFPADFYSTPLNLLMLGYIRPEYDYAGVEALVEDIRTDCDVARRSLQRESWRLSCVPGWQQWLEDFRWAEGLAGEDVKRVEREVLGGDGQAKV